MWSLAIVSLWSLCALAHPSPQPVTLKQAAGNRYFGAALGQGHLQNATDHEFAFLAAQQFSAATPENEMKWEITEPFQNVFNFTPGESIVKFTKQNNQKLRCHNLVWHSQLAPYVANLTGNAVKQAMLSHIQGVAGHFKDDCYAWDVVNEPFNDDANATLRNSTFFDVMGADYIEIALRKARQVTPKTKLYLNDYNIEGINVKSNAMYNLAVGLTKKGLLDGIGLESHFILNELPPDIQTNMERFAALGLDVAVTELDIRGETPFNSTQLTQQAANYATVINACKAVSRCVGVTTWGITDIYSWIPPVFPGEGEALLWDDNYKEKPAFTSTIAALKGN